MLTALSFLLFPLTCLLLLLSISPVCLLPLTPGDPPSPRWTPPPRPPQDSLCSAREVLEGGDRLYSTVAMLLSVSPPPQVQLAGFALFYLSVMSVLCAIYAHLAPCV